MVRNQEIWFDLADHIGDGVDLSLSQQYVIILKSKITNIVETENPAGTTYLLYFFSTACSTRFSTSKFWPFSPFCTITWQWCDLTLVVAIRLLFEELGYLSLEPVIGTFL